MEYNEMDISDLDDQVLMTGASDAVGGAPCGAAIVAIWLLAE